MITIPNIDNVLGTSYTISSIVNVQDLVFVYAVTIERKVFTII